MRRLISVSILVLGLSLIAIGALRYLHARDEQERNQLARDRHWSDVQREASRRRILPGEERPAAAPLPAVPSIIAFCGSGVAVTLIGFTLFVARSHQLPRL